MVNFFYIYITVYNDLSKLNSDIRDNKFINYIKYELITGKNGPYVLKSTFINNENDNLYFFFENTLEEKIRNINLTIFSVETSYTVNDILINEIGCNDEIYYFNIPINH